MNQRDSETTNTADREIVNMRIFYAPRELVWKAWTDPKHVAEWWGPNGFTTTIHEMDVRPGGVWRFTMHGPDGVDYKNKIVFIEIAKPARIVYDHVSGPKFQVTATFDENMARPGLHFACSSSLPLPMRQFGRTHPRPTNRTSTACRRNS